MQIISIVLVVMITAVQAKKVNVKDLINQKKKYFQGDIFNVPLHPNRVRNGIKLSSDKWPNATIPYVLNVAESRKALVLAVMNNITLKTCVKFVNRTTQVNYVNITRTSDGCYSSVGMTGGRQDLSLQDDSIASCMSNDTVMHELLHTVGLWHEHQRYDRDTAVTIMYDNIEIGSVDQFSIISSVESDVYGIPFDYMSIMLYDAYAFSKTGAPTIVPKVSGYLNTIGNVKDASENDMLKIRKIYNCPDLSTTTTTTTRSPCQDVQITMCLAMPSGYCVFTEMQTMCPKKCGICK